MRIRNAKERNSIKDNKNCLLIIQTKTFWEVKFKAKGKFNVKEGTLKIDQFGILNSFFFQTFQDFFLILR